MVIAKKFTRNSLALASILALSAVWTGVAWSQQAAGTILGIKGEVVADSDGGQRTLLKGDTVYVGDTLLTGAHAYLVIDFVDEARATLRAGTRVTLERYDADNGGASIRLERGGLRARSGSIAAQGAGSYVVSTPYADLEVPGDEPGTEFLVRLCEQDCAAEQSVYIKNMVEQTVF